MDASDGGGALPTPRVTASERPGGTAVHSPTNAPTVALVGLFTLAVLYTLFLARPVLLPIVLATVLALVLWPVVRWLKQRHVPEWLGALVVLLLLCGGLARGVFTLSAPASAWLQTAPEAVRRIEARVRVFKETVHDIGQATTQVENLTNIGKPAAAVTVREPGLGALLLSGTWDVVASLGVVVFLAYFLLASGDLFLRKLVTALPRLRDRKLAVALSHEIQASVSAYLFAISAINAAFGVAVGTAMYALGVPNPVLWGAMAALLNFIPIIGPLVGIGIITAVALLSFPTITTAAPPVLAYLTLHILEGSFLTPLILSRRFTLNPVVVVLGLFFWGWIWGIPGVLLSMPLLVSIKILCDHMPTLAVVGDFLGD